MLVATLWSPVGSPPHTRGKGTPVIASQGTEGITPARAGKSRFEEHRWTLPRDHPRTRGEKLESVLQYLHNWGSPPHARGKGLGNLRLWLVAGITPARAGKRAKRHSKYRLCWDHPRTRGEKHCIARIISTTRGSPPHARGKACWIWRLPLGRRITPARAGKSRYL